MHARLIQWSIFISLFFVISLSSAYAAEGFLQNKEYKFCMQLTRTNPEQAFEKALQWQDLGGGPASRHCMAVALFELGHYPEAALRLEELATQMPDDTPAGVVADILGHAGFSWLSAGENSKAYAVLSSALKLSPKNPNIRTDRATILFDAGKYQESIDDLSAALEVLPDQPDILVLRASAYRQVDKFDMALKDLDAALYLDPENPEGLLERGMIYRLTGKEDIARADWLKLIELHDGRPAAESARRNIELLDLKK